MSPARNSAQPSEVTVSAGSESDTRTSTVSPDDVVIGPPRKVVAARASRVAWKGAAASASSVGSAHRARGHLLFGARACGEESADEERPSENDGETPHRRERHLALIATGV